MTMMHLSYEDLTLRNEGYVSLGVQQRIRQTSLLVAGCGIGSTIAEALIRIGFERLTLIDGDTVSLHNLNRQNFTVADIGRPKVDALKSRLLAINPMARIMALNDWVTTDNVSDLAAKADIVIDTIDFLDLEAIVALHDESQRQKKPVVSALSAGWGAAALYFPPDTVSSFRDIFGLPKTGSVKGASYVEHFKAVIERLGSALGPEIRSVMTRALTVMEDGQFCPAPQISAGACSVAALTVTILHQFLNDNSVVSAPQLMLLNVLNTCSQTEINLAW